MPQPRPGFILLASLALLWTSNASAQEDKPPASFGSIVKTVIRDPSVYAPATAKYASMQLDWSSSQIFFRNGFIERNKTFTVTGRSNDTPIGYGAGNRKVALHAGMMLGWWVAGNVAERTVEKILISRFENKRRLVTVAGQAARVAGTSFLTYSSSIGHMRQWRRNEQLARHLGFK